MGRRRLEYVAYHEAGHAVMAYLERRAFRYVSIEPNEESLGHIMYRKFGERFHPDYDEEARIRPQLEKAILSSLAGHASECIYRGRNNWVGSATDRTHAFDLASYISGSFEETEAYVNWLWVRCRVKIKTHWFRVTALADQLLKHHRIRYPKVKKIIKDAKNKEITG